MRFSESLKKNADFQRVYKEGKSYANRYLVMYVLGNQSERNRLGISVSKRVGNSVVRHRITRLIRESYRLQEDIFNSGLDMVIIARKGAKDKTCQEIESALLHLSKLHGVINPDACDEESRHRDAWKISRMRSVAADGTFKKNENDTD